MRLRRRVAWHVDSPYIEAMLFNKKKLDEESKLRYERYLEDLKKLREEEKRKEDEENAKKIGDKTVGEVKSLVRLIVRDEAWAGDLPFLNRARKRSFEKYLWVGILVLIGAGLIYWNFRSDTDTDYKVQIERDKLFVSRTIAGANKKSEIKLIDNKWHLCKESGEGCLIILTPLEASYWYYDSKFVFLGRGRVFWVTNEKTDPREVKLMDGEWVFRNIDSDEGWTSFEEMIDAVDFTRDE